MAIWCRLCSSLSMSLLDRSFLWLKALERSLWAFFRASSARFRLMIPARVLENGGEKGIGPFIALEPFPEIKHHHPQNFFLLP